ncbi:FtsJ-like methyltransferase-domain-containing protein [Hysterangium stoloniferum]|nr:FtsJ-like methyltransferase-domain-containing protein [Hysterangium stoloniferum]
MRPSPVLPKAHASKQRWLARQFQDPYVKRRVEDGAGFRSRSAFKLLEMDQRYKFLTQHRYHKESKTYFPRVVVDLGAAPGGWSQVLSMKLGHGMPADPAKDVLSSQQSMLFGLNEKAKTERRVAWSCAKGDDESVSYDVPTKPPRIKNKSTWPTEAPSTLIAVDLLPIRPIPGVLTIQEDFLSPLADALIRSNMPPGTERGVVDLILSDMAPNISGNATADMARCLELWEATFRFAKRYLTTQDGKSAGGSLVIKYFESPEATAFCARYLTPSFRKVFRVKPCSSRGESAEKYWVCMGWCGLPGSPLILPEGQRLSELANISRDPFSTIETKNRMLDKRRGRRQ